MHPVAQLVECVQVVTDAALLIDRLLAMDFGPPRLAVVPRAGRGVGAVEVPRGILYHMYEFDGKGRIVRADCVIPTSQNHANIQKDGTYSVVAPVLGGTGEIEASLCVSGPIFRFSDEEKARLVQDTVRAARDISMTLGGTRRFERSGTP